MPYPIHSYLTKLYFSATGAGGFTEITGLMNIDVPEMSATATPSDSLSDLGKITIPGKVDLGELTVTALFSPTLYGTIFNSYFRVAGYYRVVYPDGSQMNMQGYVRTVSPPTADDDETVKFNFTVKVNSFPTFAAAA